MSESPWNNLYGTPWNSACGFHDVPGFDIVSDDELAESLDDIDIADVPEADPDAPADTDWQAFAEDYLSGDRQRLIERLPEHLRPRAHPL